jgi:hypothetical protein
MVTTSINLPVTLGVQEDASLRVLCVIFFYKTTNLFSNKARTLKDLKQKIQKYRFDEPFMPYPSSLNQIAL